MKARNAVIIGCGAISHVHAAAIAGLEHASLYGVCDIVPERSRSLAESHGCHSYTDIGQVLGDDQVDSIHICTPHYLHAPMSVMAAQAGKHIVLEKPAAMNLAEFQTVHEAVSNSGVNCCVILQNRYNPSVAAARRWIDEGMLGQMRGIKGFLTWKRSAEYYRGSNWRGRLATEGGGLLINQAVHMLDMLFFLGGEIESVKGNTDTRVLRDVIEVEDTAEATLYYKDGKTGLFYGTNGYSSNSPFFIEMDFEGGLLRYMDGQLILVADGKQEVVASDQSATIGKSYWGDSHRTLIQHFYDSFHGDTACAGQRYTDLSDAACSMQLLDAIYASSASRRQEPLPALSASQRSDGTSVGV